MSEEKGSVRFDHREMAVIFSLFIFVALLMFTVGILVGKGLTLAKYEGQAAVSPNLASVSAPTAHAPETHSPGTHVTTASHESTPETDHPADPPKEQTATHTDSHPTAEAKPEEKHAEVTPSAAEEAKTEHEPLNLIPAEPPTAKVHGELEDHPHKKQASKILANPKLRDIFEGSHGERAVASIPKTIPASAGAGAFTVQVAAYPSKKEADERVEALKKLGFPHAYTSAKQLGEGRGTWYRVWLGYYPDYKTADASGAILQGRGEVKSYFVRKSEKEG